VDAAKTRAQLVEQLLSAFRAEYADALDTWRALETKAQVATTTGGVFMAAAFAFVRDLGHLPAPEQYLLLTALALLVASVIIGILVFKVVPVVAPPYGRFIEEATFDLLRQSDDQLLPYAERFVRDQAVQWREAIESIVSINDQKATLVLRLQIVLITAISLTAFFTIFRIMR
jgi:hypothetical protein